MKLLITAGITAQDRVIIDSNISFEESIKGKDFPAEIKDQLVLVDVLYYSFDGLLHKGQLLINKNLEKDINKIFEVITELKFPVGKVVPISKYNWNDSLSMSDNNTSAFNFRIVKGTKVLSAHSAGRAVDLNPKLNPQIKRGKINPPDSKYEPGKPGTLTKESEIVLLFNKLGWQWGGSWKSSKDYQHFEKP